ncbi:hypothetical protein SYNGFB01_00910 [Synechococcus sp. GFB01]|nr:hypothetical protein SYNGFB01_00910 [Synechococcus sp. GFB01]
MIEIKAERLKSRRAGMGTVEGFHPSQARLAALQEGAEVLHQLIVVGIGGEGPEFGGKGIDHLTEQAIDGGHNLLQPVEELLLTGLDRLRLA